MLPSRKRRGIVPKVRVRYRTLPQAQWRYKLVFAAFNDTAQGQPGTLVVSSTNEDSFTTVVSINPILEVLDNLNTTNKIRGKDSIRGQFTHIVILDNIVQMPDKIVRMTCMVNSLRNVVSRSLGKIY